MTTRCHAARCRLLAQRDMRRRRTSLVANGAKRSCKWCPEQLSWREGPGGDVAEDALEILFATREQTMS